MIFSHNATSFPEHFQMSSFQGDPLVYDRKDFRMARTLTWAIWEVLQGGPGDKSQEQAVSSVESQLGYKIVPLLVVVSAFCDDGHLLCQQINACHAGLDSCGAKHRIQCYLWKMGLCFRQWSNLLIFLEIGDCPTCNENQPLEHLGSKSVLSLHSWLSC